MRSAIGATGRRVLGDPVLSGQPGVNHAVGNVARHFLRPDEHAVDLAVVNRGVVGARIDVDVEPGAREQLDRGVLKRSLGQTEFQRHGATSAVIDVKQDRAPV
jgi:hypothetical protein